MIEKLSVFFDYLVTLTTSNLVVSTEVVSIEVESTDTAVVSIAVVSIAVVVDSTVSVFLQEVKDIVINTIKENNNFINLNT